MWLKTISKRTIRLRSGIRFEINATPHSFKSFQQITPSHRRHIPARRERHIKQVSGFLHSSDRKSAQPNAGFQNGMRGELYQQNRIFSQPGDFLSLPVERKLRLDREVPLLPSLRNPAFAGTPSGLSKPRKQRSAFSKTFQSVCTGV